MPLTSAERAQRYRDKLKNNPEKAEEVRQKQLARLKAKRKKVSEMTEEEKKRNRQRWKEEKQKQRAKSSNKKAKLQIDQYIFEDKSNDNENANAKKKRSTTFNNNNYRKALKNLKCMKRKVKNDEKRIKNLTKLITKHKKRYLRLKQTSSELIEKQQLIIEKLEAREEILEITLRRSYENCKKRTEKDVMKQIVKNCKVGERTYVSKLMGFKRKMRIRQKKNRKTCSEEIKQFWLRDDVTRATAGKKECRSLGKEKHQIRYTTDTLQNLYKKYRQLGGTYGMTSLWKYKPFFVLYPHLNSRNTCLCIKHANIDLKFKALQLYGPLKLKTLDEVVNAVTCDRQSYYCAANQCPQCKNFKVPYNYSDRDERSININWWQWECIDYEYVKKDGNESKSVKTKKTVKSLKTTSILELKRAFDTEIIKFKKHIFIMKHQHNQYQMIINNLHNDEAVIICDFSENYECKMREEVQALHFGASKNQVSLHTGAIFWQDCMQSFCTISENTSHKPENIWSHLNPILKLIKEMTPNIKILHFFSDGPTSQYRQKGNFQLLNKLPNEMGFEYCTWSFSESGHGKSIADGIGGSVKRTLDRHVSYGVDATNATQIYYLLSEYFKTTKIFLVDDSKIDYYKAKLENLKTLTGTLKLHQIITLKEANEIKFRDLSCFCSNLKGLCLCYSPKSHLLSVDISPLQPSSLRSIRHPKKTLELSNDYPKIPPKTAKNQTENEKQLKCPNVLSDISASSLNQVENINIDNSDKGNDDILYKELAGSDLKIIDSILTPNTSDKAEDDALEIVNLTQSSNDTPPLLKCLEALSDDALLPLSVEENDKDSFKIKEEWLLNEKVPGYDDNNRDTIIIPFETDTTKSAPSNFIEFAQSSENNTISLQCIEVLSDDLILSSDANDIGKDFKDLDDSILDKENFPIKRKLPLNDYYTSYQGNAKNPYKKLPNFQQGTSQGIKSQGIKRGVKCNICSSSTGQLGKCIVCTLWYCASCAGNQVQIDLICDSCLSKYFA